VVDSGGALEVPGPRRLHDGVREVKESSNAWSSRPIASWRG
jgi:hypothetical protein